ncbi:MAG: tetratricopeptide repeat protein [Granulosicoccus sp.]
MVVLNRQSGSQSEYTTGARRGSLTARVLITLVSLPLLLAPILSAADQNAPELPGLFSRLKAETDPAVAKSIEEQIWQHWFVAPDDEAASMLSQVSQAMSQGQFDIALRLCNQLVYIYPEFAEGWNRRATVQYQLKNHAASVADIRETIRLEPRHFGAISGLGLIFLRTKDYPAALEAFEQVLAISPASVNAKRSIEFVRAEMGREI